MSQWKSYRYEPRQGLDHIKKNIPCQDAIWVSKKRGKIVAVLSDGLGQYSYSQIASKIVTETVGKFLLNLDINVNFDKDVLKKNVLEIAKESIVKDKNWKKYNGQMDCTLLFLLVDENVGLFLFGQLGDGAICMFENKSGICVEGIKDTNMVSANQTNTVMSATAMEGLYVDVKILDEWEGFLLTSDGLANELYSPVSGVKKNAEAYINAIGCDTEDIVNKKIEQRLDEIIQQPNSEFTDDISFVAIVKDGVKVSISEDVTWLCVCGCRNPIENSRCGLCNKDFLRMYKGIKFKSEYGGKYPFFESINGNYEKEIEILKRYSEYPLDILEENYEEKTNFQYGVSTDEQNEMLELESMEQTLPKGNKSNFIDKQERFSWIRKWCYRKKKKLKIKK